MHPFAAALSAVTSLRRTCRSAVQWRREWLLAVIFLLGALGTRQVLARDLAAKLPTTPAGGLLYFVNTTSDVVVTNACANGLANCSLRGAIQAANSHPGEDGIEFSLPAGAVINLTSALPAISDSVSIFGPGASALTVRRNTTTAFRIFQITAGGAGRSLGHDDHQRRDRPRRSYRRRGAEHQCRHAEHE